MENMEIPISEDPWRLMPHDVISDIMSRLPTAKDVVKCAVACRSFHESLPNVRALRFTCKLEDVRVRGIRKSGLREPFNGIVRKTLQQMKCVEKLHLEVEDEIMKPGNESEVGEQKLWLSQSSFVDEWLPHVSTTLQDLTIIDYGPQALQTASQLLHRLSHQCKQLHTLELRNMFLATSFQDKLFNVTKLTLQSVRLSGNGLKDLIEMMPNLETLTLMDVVGLEEVEISSPKLKVCEVSLGTGVNSVKLSTPNVGSGLLKMPSRDDLTIHTPGLEYKYFSIEWRGPTELGQQLEFN